MRCSGWSSRAIWACSAAAAALVLPGTAAAHLSIDPAKVVRGHLADLVFSIPNEDDPIAIDHVTLGIPADFDLDDAEAKPAWTQSRTGQAVTWSGGMIPKGTFARFAIRPRGRSPPAVRRRHINGLPEPLPEIFGKACDDERGAGIQHGNVVQRPLLASENAPHRIDRLIGAVDL